LGEVAFADSRWSHQHHVARFSDETAGGKLIDPVTRNAWIETEIKAVQTARVAEIRALEAPGGGAAFAHGQFVLEKQFEELVVTESVGGGFQQAGFE
jgi:hypothetical protein